MKVTVLGSGTTVPTVRRGHPSLLVQGDSETILIDPASGSLRGTMLAGIDPRRVTAMLISHLHLDHAVELPLWIFAFHNPELRRLIPLLIGGGPGLREHIEALAGVWGDHVQPPPPGLRIVDVSREPLSLREFQVTAMPMRHIAGSMGFRITENASGATASFTGDTELCPEVFELGRDADLLVTECSHAGPGKRPGHLTPPEALEAGRRSRCRRLLLTHFYPGWDPGEHFDLPAIGHEEFRVIIGEDGLVVDLP